ncbi:hypothetical protein MMYC01_202292 [Madurella mycetomatis]|uniref:Uncharacterized protein n=1 Tax=Madurella mycetomatis TaxID=100816 RepID=A0A175W8Y3_9PEZI|nr:hypothetical protein MMYC01_202292 [Madurella mycetomatis]
MSLPSSPAGGGTSMPLQPLSHNAQRESLLFPSLQHHRGIAVPDNAAPRDSSVHEKINQFNSLAMHSKQLERKTADAALKRAMLGREEAETEMRRYRDEARMLRKQVEEGKDRERRVGERLEAVMENYGRAKETHAHTQQLWEKEIRRTRKETFKAQSALVKLQEELKSYRIAQKAAEEELQSERERSKAREEEAFSAQYKLVGLQEQLDQALERVRMLEQERDAFKALAENQQEVRRISSESKHSLPSSGMDVEDASGSEAPRKRQRVSASNPDLEAITMMWQWEKQRADRALEQVHFLEIECQLKVCPSGKSLRRASARRPSSPRRKRPSLMRIADAGDSVILRESPRASPEPTESGFKRSKTDRLREEKESRRSTIFVPAEGIFRTVSQAEAEAVAVAAKSASAASPGLPPTPTDTDPHFRRTPSVDPPDFAVLPKERTSLLSLLDAPHRQSGPSPIFNIPTTPGPDPAAGAHEQELEPEVEQAGTIYTTIPAPSELPTAPLTDPLPSRITTQDENTRPDSSAYSRPHTSTSYYPAATTTTTTTVTTKVPLREETKDPNLAQRLMKMQRTPSRAAAAGGGDADGPSFDVNNPALTPTMTREQALAQIRERRGRAQSAGRGVGANASGTQRAISGTRAGPSAAGRKVTAAGGGEREKERGREREREGVRRQVSGPAGKAGGTVRGVSISARRVRT